MSTDRFVALAVFGAYHNATCLRWLDEAAGRRSLGFQTPGDAWAWRRRVGDDALLVEEDDPSEYRVWYAEVARAEEVPNHLAGLRLHEHILREPVIAALRHYTRQRTLDGDSLSQRARRIVGTAVADERGYTRARISSAFRATERAVPRMDSGREYIRAPADLRWIELLEASSDTRFPRRYLTLYGA